MPIHKPSETVVLLAEDDLIIRNLISLILSKQGYGLLVAVNGQEASELLARSGAPVHLLLTNVRMPIMDGITLAKLVRERDPEIRIIMMSAHMDQEIREGNMLDAFLRKPFVPATLLKSITTVLDSDTNETIQV